MSFYTYNSIIKPNFPQEDFFYIKSVRQAGIPKASHVLLFFYSFDISKFIYVNL